VLQSIVQPNNANIEGKMSASSIPKTLSRTSTHGAKEKPNIKEKMSSRSIPKSLSRTSKQMEPKKNYLSILQNKTIYYKEKLADVHDPPRI
jgi:hypothetical protein